MATIEQAWQGAYAQQWLRSEALKDKQLGALGDAALKVLAPRAGEWVVDVGCGAGATLLSLAHQVGPSGAVLGIDVSEPMLDRARERCDEAKLGNVQFALSDATTHHFERKYDALYSRFGVMFFSDAVRAFSNLRGALVAGGRLAFVCWQALELNPWVHVTLNAVARVAPDVPLPAMLRADQPGPFYFQDAAWVRSALQRAGFVEVDVRSQVTEVWLGSTLEEAVNYCAETGPSGRFVMDVGQGRVEACKAALREVLAPHARATGVWLGAAVHVISAQTIGARSAQSES